VQIFRFIDDVGAVRLDLNDVTGWALGRGFDLGVRALERTWLSQPPYDGATLASSWAPPVEMVVPLVLMPQANAAAIRTKFNALKTELDRPVNIIEFREPTDTLSYYIDTFRADVPSLVARGIDAPNMYLGLRQVGPFVLSITRLPDLRGAGTMI
jgi:hypothetical protein